MSVFSGLATTGVVDEYAIVAAPAATVARNDRRLNAFSLNIATSLYAIRNEDGGNAPSNEKPRRHHRGRFDKRYRKAITRDRKA